MSSSTGPDGPPAGGPAPGPSRSRRPRTPPAVLEVLRLLVVVFFAGAGYQIGTAVDLGALADGIDDIGSLVKFLPPKGIGLAVEIGPLKGGGYVFIDAERGVARSRAARTLPPGLAMQKWILSVSPLWAAAMPPPMATSSARKAMTWAEVGFMPTGLPRN